MKFPTRGRAKKRQQLVQLPPHLAPPATDYAETFTTADFEYVMEQIEEGRMLGEICRNDPGTPRVASIQRWCREDPALQRRFDEATKAGNEVLFSEQIDIADGVHDKLNARASHNGTDESLTDQDGGAFLAAPSDNLLLPPDIQRDKVRIAVRDRILEVRDPETFGAKQTLKVEAVDMSAAMADAERQQQALLSAVDDILGECTRVDDDNPDGEG